MEVSKQHCISSLQGPALPAAVRTSFGNVRSAISASMRSLLRSQTSSSIVSALHFHITSPYPLKKTGQPGSSNNLVYPKIKLSIVNMKWLRDQPFTHTPFLVFSHSHMEFWFAVMQGRHTDTQKITSASHHFSWSPTACWYLQLPCCCQLRLFLTPDHNVHPPPPKKKGIFSAYILRNLIRFPESLLEKVQSNMEKQQSPQIWSCALPHTRYWLNSLC